MIEIHGDELGLVAVPVGAWCCLSCGIRCAPFKSCRRCGVDPWAEAWRQFRF